jgi:tetratricopeptide (TPR) repeat protein
MSMTTVRSPFPRAALAVGFLSLSTVLAACGDGEGTQTPAARPAASGAAQGQPKGAPKEGASSAMLAYQMGLQHLMKGEIEPGEAELRRATELDPKMSEAFFELGKLKVQESSQKVWSKARDLDILNAGAAALAKACELEPGNDEYLFHLGRAHYLKDDMDGARLHLQKALEINPKLAGAWKALGRAQMDAGETERARESYERALEINAGDASGHYLLAQALESLGDLAGARAACERSIELEPSDYEVHGRLSQLCAKLGDAEGEAKAKESMQRWVAFDERLTRRQKAVDQNPNSAAAVRRVGEMYIEIGDWEKAKEWLLGAIHIDTRDWRSHLGCGIALRHLREKNAIHHLKEAEFFAPDVLDPKLELLRLYADTKDAAALGELLGSVESAAAEDGNSLYFLAEVCREIGRDEDAKRLFGKAAALGVTEPPTEFAVAEGAEEGSGEGEPEEE